MIIMIKVKDAGKKRDEETTAEIDKDAEDRIEDAKDAVKDGGDEGTHRNGDEG